MVERSTEEAAISIRTDNIEGDRIVPATDWWTWGLVAVSLFFGRTTDVAGMVWYGIAVVSFICALSFSFFFKKVQVLKDGRWETLKSLASPAEAAEITTRLRKS